MEKLKTSIVTGKVRLSYAHIWQPTSINEGQEAKYSVSLIIPKSDSKTIDEIKQAIEEAKVVGLPKFGGKIPPILKTPLRDGDIDRPDDENYADSYFINASCRTRPGIVDRYRKPILNKEEVYSGCYAFVSISLYAFNNNGNKGIAAGLNNILKCADGEPLGGRVSAEQDFAGITFDDEPEIAAAHSFLA